MRDTCNSCIKQMNKQQKIIRKNNNLNCIFSIGLMIIKYDPMWSLLSQAEFSSSARVQFSDFRYDFVFFFLFCIFFFLFFFFSLSNNILFIRNYGLWLPNHPNFQCSDSRIFFLLFSVHSFLLLLFVCFGMFPEVILHTVMNGMI